MDGPEGDEELEGRGHPAGGQGNAMVVMEREDYDRKVRELLDDTSTYHKLSKDPTPTQESQICRKLRSLHNGKEMTAKLYNRLRPSGSQPPKIYGLPKIHKESVPLRPIVSCIGSPSYKLSKHITSIISPLVGKTSSHVLRDITVGEDELLVSFDMPSLFTNVPIGEAVQVIQAKLREDDSLAERTPLLPDRVAVLLDMCLRSTYFSYGGQQREGAAMGSLDSAVVAKATST